MSYLRQQQLINGFYTDTDECASPETSECDPNAMCTNTEGSYVCRCKKGYVGDGKNCTGNFFVEMLKVEKKNAYRQVLDCESFISHF